MPAPHRFGKAIDSLFRHLGSKATYIDPFSNNKTILVIARLPEQLFELGDSYIHSENPQFEFRVSEITDPKRGDMIITDGLNYEISAEPVMDIHKLVWTAQCLRSEI